MSVDAYTQIVEEVSEVAEEDEREGIVKRCWKRFFG